MERTYGQNTLKMIHDLHQKGIKRYVALMRHSARHYGTTENEGEMGLNEEGKEAAYNFGKALPEDSFIRFFSSPVNRCVDTATLIEKGFLSIGGESETNRTLETLSVFYFKDVLKVVEFAFELIKMGNYPTFFRNWFDGKIPDLMADSKQSAQTLIKTLLDILEEPGAYGNICISHDMSLFLIKEYYLGIKAEESVNIEYLEGVFIYEWNGTYYISQYQSEAQSLKLQ